MSLSPLQRRRWKNFVSNRRGFVSSIIFLFLAILSFLAPLIANDRPLAVKFQDKLHFPVFSVYSEVFFGGDFETEANYRDSYVQNLIRANGNKELSTAENSGWIFWPPIRFNARTINYAVDYHPSPPSKVNWLGTDDQGRDVAARVLYGFRISMLFGVVVTVISTILGITAGAIQGYFAGKVDMIFQRIIEIWSQTPQLYLIMIVASLIRPDFTILILLFCFFSWTALVGVVRAEFLRARNFEYVMASRALGVSDIAIMFCHLLPNAIVAALTLLPFVLTGAISALAALDFLGFGLPPEYPSLGELALQGKRNLHAPWLAMSAFFTFAMMLSLFVFIFEAIRDAFDPRKVFV
jgi:microcin C transport system permease protein